MAASARPTRRVLRVRSALGCWAGRGGPETGSGAAEAAWSGRADPESADKALQPPPHCVPPSGPRVPDFGHSKVGLVVALEVKPGWFGGVLGAVSESVC